MPYIEDILYIRLLRDFGILLEKCRELNFAPEYAKDVLPRGYANKDGIMWYSEKELEILKPMSYCTIPNTIKE